MSTINDEFMKIREISDLDKLKNRIRMCFVTWVVTDPYPEVTESSLRVGWLEDFVGKCWLCAWRRPEHAQVRVSPHKAWMDGYNFAKSLVEKELNLK